MAEKRVVIGMSGGVDSSMAALLLKKHGYSPIGVSLRYCIWENPIAGWQESLCCSNESFRRAKRVCLKLKIPHQIIDVSDQFRKRVFDYFLESYKKGETPNPCIVCNRYLKLPALMEEAKKRGIKYIATGHYARIGKRKNTERERKRAEGAVSELLRGRDKKKDQSYFLCWLNQKLLSRMIFPLGEKTKEEVYKLAEKEGFPEFKETKQSQDLCFVADEELQPFLEHFMGERPGRIRDEKGRVLGEHSGIYHFTIGQRKGLKLSGGPWYVVRFEGNEVVVTNKKDNPLLFQKEVELADFHLIAGRLRGKELVGKAKLRSTQPLKKAKLLIDGKAVKLIFEKPVRAVTLGQFGVFYFDDICVGGGKIV